MPSVFSALIAYVISHLRSHESLRLENLALRHQLAVYQHTVKRPKLRPADRLFWSWLSRLWSDWKEALEFVQPRTVIAWQKRRFRDYWRHLSQSGTPGRPALSKDVRDLIRDMWCSNPLWGSPRIVGELRKLGIAVAKSTVEKYRPRVRKPSSPTWKAFLNNHVQTSLPVISSPFQRPASRSCLCLSCWLTSADVSCISTSPNTPRRNGPPNRSSTRFPGTPLHAICSGTGTRSTVAYSNTGSRTWTSKRSRSPRAVHGKIPTASGSSGVSVARCSIMSSSSMTGISSECSRRISPTITAFARIFPSRWIAPSPELSSHLKSAG